MGIEQQWTNAANTLVALVTTYGLRVIGAIIILVIGWILSRVLYNGIRRLCARSTMEMPTTCCKLAGTIVRFGGREEGSRQWNGRKQWKEVIGSEREAAGLKSSVAIGSGGVFAHEQSVLGLGFY